MYNNYSKVTDIDKEICYICNNNYKYFLQKPNVQGIGLGFKEIQGTCTFQKCIKVFVYQKLHSNNLSPSELIPKMYNGIITDVVESGFFTPYSLTKKVRPALGGYSIGPAAFQSTGSIGCLVKNIHHKSYYLLSCNHTLAGENFVPIGAPIIQPGIFDGGSIHTDVIASLSKYIPIKFKSFFHEPVNYVDAALAEVSNLSLVSSKIALIDHAPVGCNMPILGEKVYKIGRTTSSTTGNITAINVTHIQYYNKGPALFKDQIVTTNMSKIGDSGSMLLNDHLEAIGLLIGGSSGTKNNSFSIYNRIDHVLSSLEIEIVNNNLI